MKEERYVMPRTARQRSETDIYHITMRGVAQRIIFVDDQDRRVFLRYLKDAKAECEVKLYVWCLMTNHFHLLVHADLQKLSRFIGKLAGRYATYFNKRHGRVGHLFQDRFDSRAIDTESYLLAAVRYIHRNPIGPGLSATCNYPWSSYGEYLNKPDITDTDFIMSMFGSIDEFVAFHMAPNTTEQNLAVCTRQPKIRESDGDIVTQAQRLCGQDILVLTQSGNKQVRMAALRKLKTAGFTIGQIQSITGLKYNIVQRA